MRAEPGAFHVRLWFDSAVNFPWHGSSEDQLGPNRRRLERDDRTEEQPDRELVLAVQRGSRSAFQVLVARYQQRVLSIAYGVVRNSEDALDIAQEAFLKAYRSIDQFQGSSSFYTWLYRIVMNLSIDHVRKHSKNQPVELDDGVDHSSAAALCAGQVAGALIASPGDALRRKQLAGQLEAAFAELSVKHQQVFVLRELDGLSYKEIADVLEISVGTVMSRLFHARHNLQAALGCAVETDG